MKKTETAVNETFSWLHRNRSGMDMQVYFWNKYEKICTKSGGNVPTRIPDHEIGESAQDGLKSGV